MMFDIPARAPLLNLIFQRTEGKVYQGPFENMQVVAKWEWGDGDTAGKLLGLYEDELHEYIEKVIEFKPDLIVNYGSAEGYYGIGMAMRTQSPAILIDISSKSLAIAEENAVLNSVENIQFTTDNSTANLENILKHANRPFLFMDCEGHENIMLNLDSVPSLKHTTIMVESHDCVIAGLTGTLIERFRDTHNVEAIPQGTKNTHMDITQDLSDEQKALVSCEFRPHTMFWLYMTPKDIK